MIACFDMKGGIVPIKFRLETENQDLRIIKIHKTSHHTEEKIAGNPMRTYVCTISIDGIEKTCEIKYELISCKWTLFKI